MSHEATDSCPECGSQLLVKDYEQGEVICRQCGVVVRLEPVSQEPEWRGYTPEQRREGSRVGSPSALSTADKGLSTRINTTYRDGSARRLSPSEMAEAARLRKWHMRTVSSTAVERNLSKAMGELDKISDKLHIPQMIKERAALAYRKMLSKDLVRGRTIAAMIAAALYAACRSSDTPRTFRQIAKESGVKSKDVARCFRFIGWSLDLKMPIPDPSRHITRLVNELGLSPRIEARAIRIIREKEMRGLSSGKAPIANAAGAVYVAALHEGEGVSQMDVAGVAGVTEVTVRNHFKALREAGIDGSQEPRARAAGL